MKYIKLLFTRRTHIHKHTPTTHKIHETQKWQNETSLVKWYEISSVKR